MEFRSQESIEWETGQQDLGNELASPCTAPEPPEVTEMHDLVAAIAAVGKQRAMLRGILSQQILSRRGIRGSLKGLLIGSGQKNKQLVETLEWLKTKEDKLYEEKLVVMSNWGPGAPGSTYRSRRQRETYYRAGTSHSFESFGNGIMSGRTSEREPVGTINRKMWSNKLDSSQHRHDREFSPDRSVASRSVHKEYTSENGGKNKASQSRGMMMTRKPSGPRPLRKSASSAAPDTNHRTGGKVTMMRGSQQRGGDATPKERPVMWTGNQTHTPRSGPRVMMKGRA